MKVTKTTQEEVLNTMLVGYTLPASREELELAFGDPSFEGASFDGKTTLEWDLVFADGTIATVYDWKRSEKPLRGEWIRWNVGGRHSLAVAHVDDAIRAARLALDS